MKNNKNLIFQNKQKLRPNIKISNFYSQKIKRVSQNKNKTKKMYLSTFLLLFPSKLYTHKNLHSFIYLFSKYATVRVDRPSKKWKEKVHKLSSSTLLIIFLSSSVKCLFVELLYVLLLFFVNIIYNL